MPYKRGKKYVGQVRRNGKRIERVFLVRKEARAWEAEMRKMPEEEWNGKTNTICLFDWSQAYLNHAKIMFVLKVYREKKAVFKSFFMEVDPELSIEELTPKIVLDYLGKQMKERSGYASNKDRKNLVAAWNWGVDVLNFPPSNPCKVPKMPEVRHPRHVPSIEDFLKVYNCADNYQDKIMLLTFLHTAGRRGEIFRLKVADLDFKNSKIRLSTRKREGGNLEYDWLPMTKELSVNLSEWLKTRPVASDYVFVCLEKGSFCQQHYGQPFINRYQFMAKLTSKAEVKHFGFHAIRHLTAHYLFEQGYSVAEIQAILRHRSPNTTERYLKTLGLEGARGALESLTISNINKKPSVEPSNITVALEPREKVVAIG